VAWLAGAAAGEAGALAERQARRSADAGAADPDVWAEIGLSAALRRAIPPDEDRRLAWCTCRDGGDRS
jgi:hypothetical protein